MCQKVSRTARGMAEEYGDRPRATPISWGWRPRQPPRKRSCHDQSTCDAGSRRRLSRTIRTAREKSSSGHGQRRLWIIRHPDIGRCRGIRAIVVPPCGPRPSIGLGNAQLGQDGLGTSECDPPDSDGCVRADGEPWPPVALSTVRPDRRRSTRWGVGPVCSGGRSRRSAAQRSTAGPAIHRHHQSRNPNRAPDRLGDRGQPNRPAGDDPAAR